MICSKLTCFSAILGSFGLLFDDWREVFFLSPFIEYSGKSIWLFLFFVQALRFFMNVLNVCEVLWKFMVMSRFRVYTFLVWRFHGMTYTWMQKSFCCIFLRLWCKAGEKKFNYSQNRPPSFDDTVRWLQKRSSKDLKSLCIEYKKGECLRGGMPTLSICFSTPYELGTILILTPLVIVFAVQRFIFGWWCNGDVLYIIF
jgi:hypothetical protein